MPVFKDSNALKSAWLSARQTDGSLQLTPDLVPPGDLSLMIQTMPQQKLLLQGTQIADGAGGAVALSGVTAGPWALPRLSGCTLGNLSLSIEASQTPAALICSCQLAQAALQLGSRTLEVSGHLVDGGRLSLALATKPDGSGPADLLDVLAACGLDGKIPSGIPAFQALRLSTLQLVCGFDAAAALEFDFGAALAGQWDAIPGVLTLANPALALQAGNLMRGTSPCRSFAAQLYATAAIAGQPFAIVVHLTNREWELEVLPQSGQLLPGLLDLASLAGGQSLQSTLKGGLDALGLGAIAISAVRLGFSPGANALGWIEVRGQTSLAGANLLISLRLPELELSATLPSSPKGQTAAAAGISLRALATQLVGEAGDLPDLSITSLSLQASPGTGAYSLSAVTEEDWTWDISANGSGPRLSLQQVSCDFQKTSTGTTGGLGAVLSLGGFDLSLSGQYQGKGAGWLLSGSAASQQSVPIGNILADAAQKLGVSIPDALTSTLQGLNINSLQLVADTHSKSFQFATDAKLSGMFPLGLMAYELESTVALTSVLSPNGQRNLSGLAQASMKVGSASFSLSYDFGGTARVVRGQWLNPGGESLQLTDITQLLGAGSLKQVFADAPASSILDAFDFSLTAAAFEYHCQDGTFTLSAQSARYGDLFLSGGKQQAGRWGLLFALELPPGSKPSSIPVIGSSLAATDAIDFKRTVLLLSSASFNNYTLPALPQLPTSSGRRTVQPIGANAVLQVTPGASVVAVMDLSGGDTKARNFASVVGQDEIFLQISAGHGDVSLSAGLTGSVGIPTGGSRLVLTNPALRIDLAKELVFQISGRLAFSINGCQVLSTVRLIVDESEAEVAITISSDTGELPPPPGMKGLHFEKFGIEMGVFFEPPGLDLGLQGTFRIGETAPASDDQFALVLQVVGDVPNPLYLSFYLDQLDLGQALTVFTDKSEPDIVAALELVKASNLSLHWCENVVVLPDGSVAQPGFGFSATLQILMFSAHADLQVSSSEGIHGHAEMAPIQIAGLLRIAGAGAGITRTYQQIDGQWRERTNDSIVRTLPAPPTRQDVVLAPGGPVLEFNCQQSPVIRGNWQVSLFDIEKQSVDATFSSSGCSFALSYDLAGIEKFQMSCALADTDHLSATADCRFGLDASIGPIHVAGVSCGTLHLVATIGAGLALSLSPALFSLQITAGFDFEGLSFSVPRLTLNVAPASLAEMVPRVLQQIRENADALFAQLFNNVEKWAELIGQGIISGVLEMANLLKEVYKLDLQAAAHMMNLARQGGEAVAAGLKTAYAATAEQLVSAMKQAGYAADQIGDGLKTAYGLGSDAAAAVLKSAGMAAADVASALKNAYLLTADGAVAVLKRAGYAVEQIGGALNSVYAQTAAQAAVILKGAGYSAAQVGSALKSGYSATADVAAQAMKAAGYTASEVGDVLRNGWGASADGIAKALYGAGYAVDQVGGFLKDAFNLGPDALNGVLTGAGYAGDSVKNFFGGLGGDFSSWGSDVGHDLNPLNW